jgi:hypothetical protein
MSIQTLSISLNPCSIFPLPDEGNRDRRKREGHIFLEAFEGILITVFAQVPFDGAPKVLDEVKFTVILWEENADMARVLNDFLHQGFLAGEIWLILEDSTCTAVR